MTSVGVIDCLSNIVLIGLLRPIGQIVLHSLAMSAIYPVTFGYS